MDRRALRIAAAILIGVAALETIPIVFAFRGLGHALLRPQPPAAVAGALAIVVAYVAYAARVPGIRARIGTIGWITIPAVLLAVTAGITEEVIFRKVLMDALAAHGENAVVQVAASAVAFGVAHAIWAIRGGWPALRGAVVATTLLGAALAILYLADGRLVVPCIEAHVAIDLILEPALVLFYVERALARRRGVIA